MKIPEQDILNNLLEVIQDKGHIVTLKEYHESPLRKFHHEIFRERFGSYENALQKIGYVKEKPRSYYTDEKLIQNLQEVAESCNYKLSRKVYTNSPLRKYATCIYRDHFGSWNNAVEKAGLTPKIRKAKINEKLCQQPTYLNKQSVLNNIIEITTELGHSPTEKEYNEHPKKLCHASTIIKYHGFWYKLIEEIGECPHRRRGIRDKDLLDELYQTAIRNPDIHTVGLLLDMTKYDRTIYKKRFGAYENIKKIMLNKYRIDIKDMVHIKDQEDMFIKKIKQFYDENDRPPTNKEFEKYSGFTIITYTQQNNTCFSDLVYKATGEVNRITTLVEKGAPHIPIKKIIAKQIRKIYDKWKENDDPTYGQLTKAIRNKHNDPFLKKHFGSIENALKAAGIKKEEIDNFIINNEKQKIINSIKAVAKDVGKIPSKRIYNSHPLRICSGATVTKRFGSWENAKIAAELKN